MGPGPRVEGHGIQMTVPQATAGWGQGHPLLPNFLLFGSESFQTVYEIDLNWDKKQINKQTRSQRGRGRCGGTGVAVPPHRTARPGWAEGLWSCGGRGADKANSPLPSRSDSSPSLCRPHCSPHTLRRTLSLACTHPHPTHTTDLVGLTPESLGRRKNKEFGPWGPGPGCGPGGEWAGGSSRIGKDTCPPPPQAPGFIQAESRRGGRLEQGWAPGLVASCPLPEEEKGKLQLGD